MGKPKSVRKQQILDFVDEYQELHGRIPSIREIADSIGIQFSTIALYLRELKEEGEIEYDGARSIITKKSKSRLDHQFIPVVGTISCGQPILAFEQIETYMPIPDTRFKGNNFYYLRAKGDSMINVGINDGDYILIRKQSTATPGQMVVALKNSTEATLKRYFPKGNIVELHPENDDYEIQYIDLTEDTFDIQGVAAAVIHILEK